jgi:ankyrin repeat protein
VHAADHGGRTPVWAAAESGGTACVRALVREFGADVHTADKNGTTPVWIAACWGRTETVRALVREFGADVHTADKNGATPVWIAAFSNRAETVRALVQEFDAEINTANKNGVTPVLAAVRRPFTKTARALVECGADPWVADEDGWCPLEVAAEAGATGLLLTMLRESAAAHGAARERRLPRREQRIGGDASALRVLAAVAGRAGHAETAAMLERLERHEKVQALVESGADPWTPDEDGWCPLEMAAEAGATGLLWAMLRESAAAHGAARGHRLPRPEQRIGGDASALRVLAAVAGRAGHAETAAMLEWLEGLEKVNPEGLENVNFDYADANDEARRRGFECPVCFEETDNAVALVPCGHRVCRDCWKQTSGRGGSCPMCRVRVLHAAQPESWPPRAPLFARFCVQL